jgi:hypothetical protein
MSQLSKDQHRKQKLAKRNANPGIQAMSPKDVTQLNPQGKTPAEQKAFAESNEWLGEHADEILAAAWLLRKQGMTGFVHLNWQEASDTGVPIRGVGFNSIDEMGEALRKAEFPEGTQRSLLRNAAVADANPHLANVFIVYSDKFARTLGLADGDGRTLQQVFEADAERYLAKINSAQQRGEE